MSRHQTQMQLTATETTDDVLSFEVREVVSLLATFQAQAESSAAGNEDEYDPFSPGFPRTH